MTAGPGPRSGTTKTVGGCSHNRPVASDIAAGGIEPLSLSQQAAAAQRRWAAAYAEAHKVRRRVSVPVATLLAVYVGFAIFKADTFDPLWERADLACVLAAIPICAIWIACLSPGENGLSSLRGYGFFGLVIDGLFGVALITSGQDIEGALCLIAVVGIGATLGYGMHIPRDPSIDWYLVLAEQFILVRTARGGRSYDTIISSYRQAEEIAAAWLRRLGYPDAHTTPDRQDDGIDVEARGAIAQVKNWLKKPVGIADVQRLVGTAKPGQARFFFASHGYTRNALRWAANPDNRISLFILRPDGNIIACNDRAKRTLWTTPLHIPVDRSKTLSPWFLIPSCIILGMYFVFVLAFAFYLTVVTHDIVMGIAFSVIAVLVFLCWIDLTGGPMIKVAKRVVRHERLNIWEAFTIKPQGKDKGLPPDMFVGYDHRPVFRLIFAVGDLASRCRTLRRLLRARAHQA
jgi:Restriction endonuclease